MSAPQRIVVLGGGFAGLWSAVGAARNRHELNIPPEQLEILLVNRDAYHSIRVRNYEADLSAVRVALADVLDPIHVRHAAAEVVGVNVAQREVQYRIGSEEHKLSYDRLVMAAGSQLVRPPIPGLAEFSFDVDTYADAERLAAHLRSLPQQPDTSARRTVLVVGAGLTGIEAATEMPSRLRAIFAQAGSPLMDQNAPRVILADHNRHVGSDMGESARPVIERALASLGVETRISVSVTKIDADGAVLETGERISTATIIWCAGMRANPLTAQLPVDHDSLGRVAVDEYLRVRGLPGVFAAGDVARLMVDDTHSSVMSCQHGRPMGRFAGHNVVSDLRGAPMLPLRIEWYVTLLDLGPWGAVYTEGWNRTVAVQGAAAKEIKRTINCQRIYPPQSGNAQEIFDAAAPVVQTPPPKRE